MITEHALSDEERDLVRELLRQGGPARVNEEIRAIRQIGRQRVRGGDRSWGAMAAAQVAENRACAFERERDRQISDQKQG
jgi:hypothetical protein